MRQLAEVHSGQVAVRSAGLGQGATFTVCLPLYDGAAREAGHAPRLPEALAGRRILLVDDTLETLESFSELLALEGASVTSASSAKQALGLARASQFDLFISDIAMPGTDGYELIRPLRELAHLRETPAIALTGFGRSNDVRLAIEAGFDAPIAKPVSLDVLIQKAEKLFSNNG